MSTPSPTEIHDKAHMRRSMSVAALIMSASVLLSRVIGLGRDMVLAHFAGTGVQMDAYVAAFLLPEVVNHILAGGFLSITFIPMYQRYLAAGDREGAQRTFSNLLTVGTVALAVVIGLCMLLAPDLLRLMQHFKHTPRTDADVEWARLTVRLTRIILPAQIFFYWGSFLMAVQYAHKKFFLPALMPLVYNVGIIAGGVLLGRRFGIEGFAWGVFAGAFFGGFVIQLPGLWKLGVRYRLVFRPRDADLRKYVLLSLPFIVGLSMTFSNEFMFRFFGLFMSQGAVSYLNYALRVMMMLVGVFGLAFSAASFPFLLQLAAEGKMLELSRLSDSIVRKTIALVVPLSAVVFVLAEPTLSILFERGRFTALSTASTAPVLQMYLLGSFAFAGSTIVMRNFFAVQNTLTPMIVSTIAVAASLPLYWVLGRAWGSAGIGLAASLAMVVQFFVLFGMWKVRHARGTSLWDVPVALAKVSVLSAAGGGLCLAIVTLIQPRLGFVPRGLFRSLVLSVVAGLPSLALIFALLDLAKVQSIREIVALVRRRR